MNSKKMKKGNLISEISKEFDMKDLAASIPDSEDDFDWEELKDETEEVTGEEFSNLISFKVCDITFSHWEELKARVEKMGGYASDSKVFEFAVIEALNIPEECLGLS